MAEAKKMTMDELLQAEESIKRLAVGDTVEGTVISVKKHEILIDLGANGVGMVPRREAASQRNLEVGQNVSASVIDAEMELNGNTSTALIINVTEFKAYVLHLALERQQSLVLPFHEEVSRL